MPPTGPQPIACSVRPYAADDREPLEALWGLVFANAPPRNAPARMIDAKLGVQPELLLVAEIDRGIVGAVMAGFDGTRGWIHHLAVHPSHRERGVGRTLLREAESGLVALGCPKVNLQVRGDNEEVVAFYRKLGYAVEDRISMGKVLPR